MAKRFLFFGLVSNWREFVFYVKTRDHILQPTYFSVFGLLNVQRYREPLEVSGKDMYKRFISLLGDEVFCTDGHHLMNSENFCYVNGRISFLDYGSPKTQKIIREYGTVISEGFHLTKAM